MGELPVREIVCYNKRMAIMMNREDDRNEELTRRISADLRAKVVQTKDVKKKKNDDDDSDFVVYEFN